MPKNTDPPGYHSREITHHIVGQFKNHFSGTTDAGFRCHCGHKGGVQFTDYQAMTSPVAWELPSVVCDRVIAAWRAHTKDLDGVHPNAEDQIRDFFSRHLEQPGGPTVTTPRYPLTAIPLGTPKPKSIAISGLGLVDDENMRRIIVNYAEKLDIAVVPVESRSFEWLVTDRSTSLESATPAAMREYLARLLGADVQTDVSEELHEVAEELKREDAEASRVDLLKQVAELSETAKKLSRLLGTDWPLERADTDRPTRIILRSYAADDKPRIERMLGLARQLQIPVQLAGPWSCTAFPKGEEAHPALDVVFPEVLAHPRDVLILTFPNGEHIGDNGGGSNLSEIENQLLWETREQDQRFITGLIELLGLPADASRGDIAAAVERSGTHYEALDVRVRNILGAVDGEETDEAARRFVEASRGDIAVAVENESLDGARAEQAHRARIRYEECDAQVREILGASQGEEAVEAAKRVTAELAEWKRELASWKNNATALRQEATENQRKLLADINEALGLHPEQSLAGALQRAKWLMEQDKYQTEKLAEALGYKSDDYCELLQRVQRLVKVKQEIAISLGLHENAGMDAITARSALLREEMASRVLRLGKALGYADTDFNYLVERARRAAEDSAKLEKVGPERDGLKDRVERLVVELTNTRAEVDKLRAYQLSRLESDAYLERVKKERDNAVEQLNAIHVRILHILGPDASTAGIFDSVEKVVQERDSLGEKLDTVHRDLVKRLGLPSDTGWFDIMSAVEDLPGSFKERLETAITAERQTIAQRIDLALTGNAAVTNLDTMLRAVEACREGYTREASNSVNLRRDCEMLQGLIGQIADALDAPPGDRLVVKDDGSLNTTLADRVVGYFKRLYTAAGFTEPPQGGWSEILSNVEDTLAGECPLPSR